MRMAPNDLDPPLVQQHINALGQTVHNALLPAVKALKIDGEVGNKKVYDPRAWLKKARASMAERIIVACKDLLSEGKTLGR